MKFYLSILMIAAFAFFAFAQEKTINQELKELDEASSKQVPPALLEAGKKGTEELVAAKIAEKALNKGAKMPAFSLQDANGKRVDSADLLKQGHLVLTFYRGVW